MLVTIVTPSFNSSKFISRTISSVRTQSISDWEMIIVDDCSTDDTVEIVRRFNKEDPRIKLIELTTNSGAAVARNVAIQASQGRYIAFLDSDDLWKPNKLKRQIEFMENNGYRFTYTGYNRINEFGENMVSLNVPNKVSYNDLLKMCVIGCLTAVYDSNFYGRIEMPLIKKRQDWGLWLRLLKVSDYAYGLDEDLASYRTHDESISANKFNAASYTWRLYRDCEKLSFLKASYYFSHYAARGFLRHKLPSLAKILGIL